MADAVPLSDSGAREAPTLTTERLVLRHYRKDDLAPHHAIVGDDAVMVHVGGRGLALEDTWRRLAASVGQWQLIGIGGWAVTRREDGRVIGTVSLFNGWRDLEPIFGETPEMGWIFATEAQGQGLAREACEAVLAWADKALAPTPIWAIIAPGNVASLKLAARLGFERVGDSVYHGEPTVVLQRPARA